LHAAIGFVTDRGFPLLIAVLGLLAALVGTWGRRRRRTTTTDYEAQTITLDLIVWE
jgi:hypothetical protein